MVVTSSCTVMAVRKEDFIDLIGRQPQVCLSPIEEMADKINQLNNKVLKLQSDSWDAAKQTIEFFCVERIITPNA